jgi:DNA replication protein DnaC
VNVNNSLNNLWLANYRVNFWGKSWKVKRLIKAAKFRYPATIEELDYSLNRNLDKNELLRLSDCQWVERRQDIILTGPSGAG